MTTTQNSNSNHTHLKALDKKKYFLSPNMATETFMMKEARNIMKRMDENDDSKYTCLVGLDHSPYTLDSFRDILLNHFDCERVSLSMRKPRAADEACHYIFTVTRPKGRNIKG